MFPDGFDSHCLDLPGASTDDQLYLAYVDNSAPSPGTLLLVHGFFDFAGTWAGLAHQVGDDYRMVLPDLLGCGRSGIPGLSDIPPKERFSPSMHIAHLRELILELDLRNVILGGSSYGGGLALCTWLRYPDLRSRIRGLLLLAAALYPQPLPGYIGELAGSGGRLLHNPLTRPLFFQARLVRWMTNRALLRLFHDPDRIPGDLAEAFLEILQRRDIFYSYHWMARNILPSNLTDLVGRLREIDCPTQIIWGEEDRVIAPLAALQFREDIPHSDLNLIDDCGHAPHIEFPEEVASCIRRWFPPD